MVDSATVETLHGRPHGADRSLYLFMLLMLLTGATNALLLKQQHMTTAPLEPGGELEHFDHPFLQASFMMVGECLCFLAWIGQRTPSEAAVAAETPRWIFFVPCCCDWLATAFICMSLAFIPVSVMQMCRGSVVIFTCVLSWLFLGRRQQSFHLVGVSFVIFGISLVSASVLTTKGGSDHVLFGIMLCVFAQLFQASMYVYEERIMSKYTVQPLQVVGWEGVWGMGVAAVVLSILYPFGHANTPGAMHQIGSSHVLLLSVVASIVCVAFFNFSGATVTQRSSAVARSTIKISSTILIWIVELFMGWNTFKWLQLVGFLCVALGTLFYNQIIEIPFLAPRPECGPLLAQKGAP